MTTIRNNPIYAKRNDPCPCGSGQKYKRCCSHAAPNTPPGTRGVSYIDSGETAVRWVICDGRGTSFFCDKDGRILVFTDKAAAFAVAGLDEFVSQEPGEINVAGVGAEKLKHLCETLPNVEVHDFESAITMIRDRIAAKMAELSTPEGQTNGDQGQVKDQDDQEGCTKDDCCGRKEEAADQAPEASA